MTTILIVKKGKSIHIAADSQVTAGGSVYTAKYNKIKQSGSFTYVFCGELSVHPLFNLMVKHLKDKHDIGALQAYLLDNYEKLEKVKMNSEVYVFRSIDKLVKDMYHIEFDNFTVTQYKPSEIPEILSAGSGGDFALGAYKALSEDLQVKTRLKQSIKIASTLDLYTNDNIRVVSLQT